jgi:3-oxoacyl-[acyl-carrier protein] reductase
VTGASRGIGASTAERLARLGAHVVLAARSKDAITERAEFLTTAGLRATALAADLSEATSVDDLMASVGALGGGLDILVNNAGILPKARRMETLSRAEWNSVLDINLNVPWYLSCRAKELMAPRGGGVIINITSTAAYFPSAGLASYNVSKAALIMLTRVCALEWAKDDIRVVGVAPGKVNTEMVRPILEWTASKNLDVNPLRRIGEADEVAELIGFLVSDAAKYMTGVVVPIDGGELLTYGR